MHFQAKIRSDSCSPHEKPLWGHFRKQIQVLKNFDFWVTPPLIYTWSDILSLIIKNVRHLVCHDAQIWVGQNKSWSKHAKFEQMPVRDIKISTILWHRFMSLTWWAFGEILLTPPLLNVRFSKYFMIFRTNFFINQKFFIF